MNKTKKACCAVLAAALILNLFAGCTREERINSSELERRMMKYDSTLSGCIGEVIYRKPTYYTYFTFENGDEVLFTAAQDKYGRVKRVTVTAETELALKADGGFVSVCRASAAAMLPPECDVDALIADAGLLDPSRADKAGFSEAASGKYALWVFRGEGAVSFAVDVNEAFYGEITDATE